MEPQINPFSFSNIVQSLKSLWIIILTTTLATILLPSFTAHSAPVMNNTDGFYTDDFTNNSKVPTRSYVNVNTATEVLQLTSESSQTTFTTPYRTEGYAITSVIKPLILAEWDTLTINSTVPENTTLKVQILSDYNSVWQDEIILGNEAGLDITSSTTVIDISAVPVMGCAFDSDYGLDWGCDKVSSLKVKFFMTTSDNTVTPTVNDISVTWTVRQGDLTSTTVSQDPWPTDGGNQQRTSYVPYYNEQTYPAFKWASDTHSQDPFYSTLYVLDDKLVGYAHNSFSRLFAINRDSGEELWKIHASYLATGPMIIGSNGTFYAHDMLGDATKAIDTNTGQIKWLYNWMGGHGNGLVLAEDGNVYYNRDSSGSSNGTLIKQNPDGTIESQTSMTLVPEGLSSESKSVGDFILGSNNTVYFRTLVSQSVSPWGLTDKSRIFALDLETKSIEWSYPANIWDIIVGPDGTIYASTYSGYSPAEDDEKKLYAFNPDGTVKWEVTRSVDGSRGFISDLALTDSGMLISARYVAAGDWKTTVIELTDCNDGSLVKTINPTDTFSTLQFIDGLNGYYYSSSETIDSEISLYSRKMNYLDSDDNLKWQIIYPYFSSEEGKDIWVYLNRLVPDERGWLYGTFARDSNDLDWNRIAEDSFAKTYALAPWTLSVGTDKDAYKAGDTVTFTATTSMLTSNPVFGGNNMMQIVINGGTKVPLTYSSTDSSGNTLWTGSYLLPSNSTEGSISYTVEASQSNLKTDVTTHFDTPPAETENTGIVLGSSINVVVPSVRITYIGLIRDIPDKSPLTYYFTSTKPLIKGVTQANSTVTFKYGNQIYTAKADSDGVFSIKLENPALLMGKNDLTYYSTDTSGNKSITKSLTLIVGTGNFPEWLLEKMGLLTTWQDDAPKVEEEVVEVENEEEVEDDLERDVSVPENNSKKIKFTDPNGKPLVGAKVEIEDQTFITNGDGEIEVENMSNRKYSAKVLHDGKEYNVEVLGLADGNETVLVEIEETELERKNLLKYIGIGLLALTLVIILISFLSKRPEEDYN